jgi:hypothetical protein
MDGSNIAVEPEPFEDNLEPSHEGWGRRHKSAATAS